MGSYRGRREPMRNVLEDARTKQTQSSSTMCKSTSILFLGEGPGEGVDLGCFSALIWAVSKPYVSGVDLNCFTVKHMQVLQSMAARNQFAIPTSECPNPKWEPLGIY